MRTGGTNMVATVHLHRRSVKWVCDISHDDFIIEINLLILLENFFLRTFASVCGAAWASGSFGGDLRGPVPVPGDLLPGGGLDGAWGDPGVRLRCGWLVGARLAEDGSGSPIAQGRGGGAERTWGASALGLRRGGAPWKPLRVSARSSRIPQATGDAPPSGDGVGPCLGGQVGGDSGDDGLRRVRGPPDAGAASGGSGVPKPWQRPALFDDIRLLNWNVAVEFATLEKGRG